MIREGERRGQVLDLHIVFFLLYQHWAVFLCEVKENEVMTVEPDLGSRTKKLSTVYDSHGGLM